jgi:4-hydroxyphenylpyruvate dioxygenase-like putative hemolysin
MVWIGFDYTNQNTKKSVRLNQHGQVIILSNLTKNSTWARFWSDFLG